MNRALVALAVLAGGLGSSIALRRAHAEAVVLPGTHAVLDVPRSWRFVEPTEPTPGGSTLIAGWHGPAGELVAITRAQVPNLAAWRKQTRDAYAEQIERGIAATIRGYHKRSRKLTAMHGVPVFELEARGGDGATRVFRILLFRTYALALAIEVPRRHSVDGARAIAQSFGPPA